MSYHAWSVGKPDCNPPLRYSLQVKVQVISVLVGLDSQKVIAIRAIASLRDRGIEPIILRKISLEREEGREGDGGGSTWLGCSYDARRHEYTSSVLATYGGNRRSRLLSMGPGEQDRHNHDANQDSHLSPSYLPCLVCRCEICSFCIPL